MSTYITKYGDTVDAITHETISWCPCDVSPGIYGDDTRKWVAAHAEHYGVPMPDMDDDGTLLLPIKGNWERFVAVL